jgi:hypothetical protein
VKNSTSKITKAKWTGGVAQGIERLLWERKALSSKHSPSENKINK